ncbi:hypothetical protein Stube_24060 [Streptomyces tubercidicus]|uniref:Uncharacterized protein n=2 Tax=Streptomyces tubercidicus TaxID=47759 RepID=A0A640UNY4_9ACTN|nr:hypothetical protein Stube_24060 [Streptomyces tubercidicus]
MSEDGTMALHMLGKDPNSPEGKSATVYYDDVTDKYLVQGLKVLDDERLSQLDLPDHETVVEIPKYMTQFFPEVRDGGRADV